MKSQRDAFITALFEQAKVNPDIYLVSVDMGAPALDQWRQELPDQFLTAGISEQHAINFAAGLSAQKKRVYVYFMACWTARCLEQIRYSCAMANNPITIVGNGIGLGYAPAGPAHSPTEDIAYMKSIFGLEIFSPANSQVAEALVSLTLEEKKLRYLRLERSYPTILATYYADTNSNELQQGLSILKTVDHPDAIILASGYMLGRALDLATRLEKEGYNISVVDLFRIKPVNTELLSSILSNSQSVITLEEQGLNGGFGASVCETLADLGLKKNVLRIGLPEHYLFENGIREHLHDHNGLSLENIHQRTLKFLDHSKGKVTMVADV